MKMFLNTKLWVFKNIMKGRITMCENHNCPKCPCCIKMDIKKITDDVIKEIVKKLIDKRIQLKTNLPTL